MARVPLVSSGCSSAWLERLLWEQEVACSNLVIPTTVIDAQALRLLPRATNCGGSSAAEHPTKSEGWRERRCEWCGRDEWEGKVIPLEVDHINGIRTDHRIENLRLLCPNCHAFTDTWRGRNKKRLNKAA